MYQGASREDPDITLFSEERVDERENYVPTSKQSGSQLQHLHENWP
jgi:hypothetical protein